jgi:hypothetical protein
MRSVITYTWSDAWLLLSIIHAASGSGGASLTDIFAMGDAINKAIFTPQELRRGLAKLTSAGYVSEEGGRFFVTEKARRVSEGLPGTHVLEQLTDLEKVLGAAPYPAGDPNQEDPEWPYPQLTDETIEAAQQQYRMEFAEVNRRLLDKNAGA